MHPKSREELISYLDALGERGDDLSMLFMRPIGTSNGLVAIVRDRIPRLCYVHTRQYEIVRPIRFWLFALRRKLRFHFERWDRETTSQAEIGRISAEAVSHIEACYMQVYGHNGPLTLEFMPMGWTPTKQRRFGDAPGLSIDS